MPLAVDHHLSMPVRGTDSQKAGRAFLLGIQVFLILACMGYIFFELALAFSNDEEPSSTGVVVTASSTLEEPASLRVPVRLELDTTVKSLGDDLRLGNSENKQRAPCGEAAPSNAMTKAVTVFLAGALLNCKWARHVIAAGAL